MPQGHCTTHCCQAQRMMLPAQLMPVGIACQARSSHGRAVHATNSSASAIMCCSAHRGRELHLYTPMTTLQQHSCCSLQPKCFQVESGIIVSAHMCKARNQHNTPHVTVKSRPLMSCRGAIMWVIASSNTTQFAKCIQTHYVAACWLPGCVGLHACMPQHGN